MTGIELIEFYDIGKLAGVLHLPNSSKSNYPAVIFCPGKNGERVEAHRLAIKMGEHLAERGIAFFRFDYYGLGLSDGSFHEMSISTKLSNVCSAFHFLKENKNVSEVAYLGFSDGARTALLAANRSKVKKLALWSPVMYEIGGNLPGGKKMKFCRHPRDRSQLVMAWNGYWTGISYYKELIKYNIEREVLDFCREGESILVYGKDDLILKEEFEMMGSHKTLLYTSDQSKVIRFSETGHLFSSASLEKQLIEVTGEWFEQTFDKNLVKG
ncbi:MAG: alpha/beta hydrolase [Bacillota bacterium]